MGHQGRDEQGTPLKTVNSKGHDFKLCEEQRSMCTKTLSPLGRMELDHSNSSST